MAIYNNGYPVGYQPYGGYQQNFSQQIPQVQQPMQQPVNNGINWAQGEAGARSFYVAPGKSEIIMDSENSCFYIKSVDASGMPLPLRIFDYTERVTTPSAQPQEQPQVDMSGYITRDEFNELSARIDELTKKSTAKKEK